MLRANTKIFDGQVMRLDLVGKDERRIRTVIVLNNTPYFLYVGQNARPGREDALFIVQPYSDVTMPVDVAQQLYVAEGPAIGVIPANCQAVVMWGPDTYQMAARTTGRNVVIPIFDSAISGPVTGTVSGGLRAQGLGPVVSGGFGGGGVSDAEAAGLVPFAVPASATRRSIYGVTSAALTSAYLRGSVDGVNWLTLADLEPTASGFLAAVPADVALPPYLSVEMSGNVVMAQVWMVVDL